MQARQIVEKDPKQMPEIGLLEAGVVNMGCRVCGLSCVIRSVSEVVHDGIENLPRRFA